MPFSKDFWILSVKPIFCWTFFVWHNAPKMDAFIKDGLNVKPVLLKQNALQMDAFCDNCSYCETFSCFWCSPHGCLWMPFLSKIVNIQSFLFDILPWNRWWQMFSMSTPCFVRPSFGKDALNFENPFNRDILHAKCSPALWNKAPRMSSCLVFWDEESKNKLSDTYSKSFSGLLTFSLGSGCISGSWKIIPKCSLSLEIWNLFWTTF